MFRQRDTVALDARLIFQELLERMAAFRTVNARHAQNHGGKFAFGHSRQQQLFRFDRRIFAVSTSGSVGLVSLTGEPSVWP